jgi:hypothetical protein
MAQKANGLAKNYELLTARERLRMLLEAQAREDMDEVNRLRATCPQKVYRTLDHAFDAAHDTVMTLVFVFCIDLAHHLGMVEMARRLGRATEVLLILAGSEAAEDVADDLISLIAKREQETGETPAKNRTSKGSSPTANDQPDLSGAEAAVRTWMTGDIAAAAGFSAQHLPQTQKTLYGLLSQLIADRGADVRSILEGLSRFTRRTLGLESIDVIRAWMPCIARRVEALPPIETEIDHELVIETETVAWKYWHRMLNGQ